MTLCILSAGKLITLAASLFTLSWTHSVERVRWEEDWRVTPAGLELVAARIKGSAAGMEVPDDAVLKDGWWTYRPSLPVRPEISLAASGATLSPWRLCTAEECVELGATEGDPITLSGCTGPQTGESQPR